MLLSELKAGDWFRWADTTWMLLDAASTRCVDLPDPHDSVALTGMSRGVIMPFDPETEVKRIDVAKQLGQIRDLRLGFAQCRMDHRNCLADVRKAQDSLTNVIEVLK